MCAPGDCEAIHSKTRYISVSIDPLGLLQASVSHCAGDQEPHRSHVCLVWAAETQREGGTKDQVRKGMLVRGLRASESTPKSPEQVEMGRKAAELLVACMSPRQMH